MTIYSYTLGSTDGSVNVGSGSYSSSSRDYAPVAAKFNIDSSWFNPDGSINTATATSTAIFNAQNPSGTTNDAYVSVTAFNDTTASHTASQDLFRVNSASTAGYSHTYDIASGEVTLTGSSATGYDFKFFDGAGTTATSDDSIFNIHFTGTPTGNGTAYSYGSGLSLVNSASFLDTASESQHFFDKDNTIVCFAKGTKISTIKGLVAVEKLKAGDQVLTIDGEHAPIVWLGHRRVNCLKHSQPELANPVRVSKDAFGPGMPSADVLLSPAHAVYAYGHLAPVRHLINDVTITQESVDSITYYHIELPKHTVIFAQGLPAETYLDSDNRQFFISADQVATNVEKLDTVEFSENYGRDLYLANCYAPFVTEGPVLEAIQEKLLAMPAAKRLALALAA